MDLFFNYQVIFSARSIGDFLFNFERTIATFVDISQSNFVGGISALIPSKVSGKIISPSLISYNNYF